jgi:hypothetical protein
MVAGIGKRSKRLISMLATGKEKPGSKGPGFLVRDIHQPPPLPPLLLPVDCPAPLGLVAEGTGPLSVLPPSPPLGSESASGSALVAGDAGSRVWLVPSFAVGVDVSPAAIAYSELPDSNAARVNDAILWFSMVALPMRGELQHWKKVCGEGAVHQTNGYRPKGSHHFDV